MGTLLEVTGISSDVELDKWLDIGQIAFGARVVIGKEAWCQLKSYQK